MEGQREGCGMARVYVVMRMWDGFADIEVCGKGLVKLMVTEDDFLVTVVVFFVLSKYRTELPPFNG